MRKSLRKRRGLRRKRRRAERNSRVGRCGERGFIPKDGRSEAVFSGVLWGWESQQCIVTAGWRLSSVFVGLSVGSPGYESRGYNLG